jgi:adenylosuccinate synthase
LEVLKVPLPSGIGGRVIAIVGLQYGSEGKGHVSHLLSSLCNLAIRTGGPNAGHTIRHRGVEFKMRQVPCAFVNPASVLAIGPGGLINAEVLENEISTIQRAGYTLAGRLYVHENVGVIAPEHIDEEKVAQLRESIGSTVEGVGAATAARALRRLPIVKNLAPGLPTELTVIEHQDYLEMLRGIADRGNVLLEGTQGAGLSLYHGSYPYVTSRDVSASGLAGASGIPPNLVSDVVGVARTFPIRVAGNSGPLPYETSFDVIGVQPERTTVTGNIRRIAHFDPVAFRSAVLLNGPTSLALTFADYLPDTERAAWVSEFEALSGVPVDYVGVAAIEESWKKPGSLFDEAARRWDELGGTSPASANQAARRDADGPGARSHARVSTPDEIGPPQRERR